MYLSVKCILDLNQLLPDFFNNRGPQLQQYVDRLLKDNFAPDPDLLLCCAVVKTLYVKGEIYLGPLHLLPGKLFHRNTVFPGQLAKQFKSRGRVDLHLRNSRQQAPVDLHPVQDTHLFSLHHHGFLHVIIIICLTGIPGLPHRGSSWSIRSLQVVLSRTMPILLVTSSAPLSPAPPRCWRGSRRPAATSGR
jgi:hypothetical protein